MQIRKADSNYNNDPYDLEANRIAEEKLVLEDVFMKINTVEFKYDWLIYFFVNCCGKRVRKDKYNLRKKYFESAMTFVDYYLDISIYFKKMMEVDLIKSLYFEKLQKSLFSIASSPNFSFIAEKDIKRKLEEIYVFAPILDNKMDYDLTNMINYAKDDEKSEKILGLIQNNNTIFE